MKKLVGIAAAIGGLAVIAGICYFVYKHFLILSLFILLISILILPLII